MSSEKSSAKWLLEQIPGLTVLQAAELSKAMEEVLGVSAAAPVFAQGDTPSQEIDRKRVTLEIPTDASLTSQFLASVLVPYLCAISNLQHVINDIKESDNLEVRIVEVKQNSPINVTLEGAAEAVNLVKETIVPWRRKHAETMAKLQETQAEEEVAIKRAEVFERHARATKDRQEANKLAAEAAIKRAEAEKLGVSASLCKRVGSQSAHWYAALKDDGELVHGTAPFTDGHRPFLADVAQRQV